MKSLKGQLLIAAPHLGDKRFERAVILLLHHDHNGAMGVVLNHPLAETVSSMWQKLGRAVPESQQRVNLGGPVAGPIIALHGTKSLGQYRIPPGLYVADQKELLDQLVESQDLRVKIFVGHAGWRSGQLESEIADGSWLTMPAALEHVFTDIVDRSELWVRVVRQKGCRFLTEVLGIHDFPRHPLAN